LRDLPSHNSSRLHEEFTVVDEFTNTVAKLQEHESSLDSSQKWKLLSLQMMVDILKELVIASNIEKLQSRMVAMDECVHTVEKSLNTHLNRKESIRQEIIAEQVNLSSLQKTIKDLTDLENQRLHDFMDLEANYDLAYGKAESIAQMWDVIQAMLRQ
ncbi:hypothetical protein A2U01_0011434, partial [Trifolium medium]|nr:hypothetical protein [Trifolium medium]